MFARLKVGVDSAEQRKRSKTQGVEQTATTTTSIQNDKNSIQRTKNINDKNNDKNNNKNSENDDNDNGNISTNKKCTQQKNQS